MLAHRNNALSWHLHGPEGRAVTNRIPAAGQGTMAENDAFLWSLADLMTLLLIFFIMLYATAIQPTAVVDPIPVQAAVDPSNDSTDTLGVFPASSTEMAVLHTDAVGEQAQHPDPTAVTAPAAETPAGVNPGAETVNRQMIAELADSFSKDFYVRWEKRQPVIVLGERITFEAGQALLLVDAHGALKRVAGLISRIGDCRVVISGHTDDRPIRTPTFPSNWELSAARAASVAKVLMANGIAPRQLTIQGQSEFKPLLANTSRENRRANRRVEISVITDQPQALAP